MKNKATTWLVILVCLFGLLNFGGLVLQPDTIVYKDKIIEVEANCTPCETCQSYVLNKAEFEDEAVEAKAEELALESVSLDNKDFKEALFDALVDFGEDIDSYKDITEVSFKYEVDGDEVEFSKVKVYYYVDDDTDETYKARLDDFKVEVLDLDYDDEFEDAEVDEDYFDDLNVSKVYEQ